MPGFFLIEGEAHAAALRPGARREVPGAIVARDGDSIWIHLDGRAVELVWQDALSRHAEASTGAGGDLVRAPMPGAVIAHSAAPGDIVDQGAALLVIESMKLEMVIRAPRAGTIAAIHRAPGQSFERDALLVTLVAEDAA